MNSTTEPASLRRAFDALERSIGAPLEELVAEPSVTSLLILTFRTQAGARRLLDAGMASLLHFWNLPTRGDIARLARQVAALDHALRQPGDESTGSRPEPGIGTAAGQADDDAVRKGSSKPGAVALRQRS